MKNEREARPKFPLLNPDEKMEWTQVVRFETIWKNEREVWISPLSLDFFQTVQPDQLRGGVHSVLTLNSNSRNWKRPLE